LFTRLIIRLEADERNALNELACRELRDPRDQIRIVLRKELERLGLLKSSPKIEDFSKDQMIGGYL
jgi:hypothetical protein